MNKKLLLIDGSGLSYRAFYALPELKTSSGFPVNAVYGFVNMLLSALEREKPDYIAASFDKSAPTVRIEKFKDYKIQRQKQPENLSLQFPLIEEYLKILGIPVFTLAGHEADDCLSTIAKRAEEKNIDTLILTGDLDFLQVVDDKIKVLMMRRGIKDLKLYDEAAIKERYNLSAAQMRDYKALAGDASDNIPGVRGIGGATAVKLLGEFGTIENLLQNLNKLSEKTRKAIQENKEMLLLSKELVGLELGLPLDIDWEELKAKNVHNDADNKDLIGWYQRLEFKNILSKIVGTQPPSPLMEKHKIDYIIVDNVGAQRAVPLQAKKYAFSVINENGKIFVGLCSDDKNYFIDANKTGFEPVSEVIKKILATGAVKTFSDLKLFIKCFNLFDIDIDDKYFDACLADYLLNPENTNIKITSSINRYLGINIAGEKELLGAGKQALLFSDLAADAAANHLCSCAFFAGKLKDILLNKLKESKLDELYYNIELPLAGVLAAMEDEGITLNVKKLKTLSGEVSKKITEKEKEIFNLAGAEFNINSPKQVGEVLFEKLLIPNLGRTKTGYKTDADTLRDLAFNFPIAAKILEYREMAKLKSTYIDALPLLVDENDKLHTTYNQTGTSTGRLSSSDPNLQNIPIRSDAGRQIRACFTAMPDNVLVIADYSQIELRILAHLSGDENLIAAFKDDLDIHTQTAAKIFGIRAEEVTEVHRRKAKEINFGINYGMGEFGLSQRLGITRFEAKNYIENYFKNYPKVKEYIDQTIKSAEKDGFVCTLFGRRRFIADITSRNATMKKQAERMAVNAPIQGSASDIIKAAMVNLYDEINKCRGLINQTPTAKLLLQVHDELVLQCPQKDAEKVKGALEKIMENIVKLTVPLKVNISIGKNWDEME